MSRSLSIKGKTQANTALTSTINYVNPNATDEQLVSLATAFNNLTTNTISDISRIDKESLINVVPKLPRNVQILDDVDGSPVTEVQASSIGNIGAAFYVYIKYDSDDYTSDIITQIVGDETNPGVYAYTVLHYELVSGQKVYKGLYVFLAMEAGTVTAPFALHFAIGATNTYQAATFDIPIVL